MNSHIKRYDNMTINVTVSLSPEAYEIYREIPSGQRSKLYETALLMLKKQDGE